MTKLQSLLRQYRFLSRTEREKGTYFELLIQCCLKTEPGCADLYPRSIQGGRRHRGARTADDKDRLERRISATDQEIDHIVYELYGLTDEEIRIVKGEHGRVR